MRCVHDEHKRSVYKRGVHERLRAPAPLFTPPELGMSSRLSLLDGNLGEEARFPYGDLPV